MSGLLLAGCVAPAAEKNSNDGEKVSIAEMEGTITDSLKWPTVTFAILPTDVYKRQGICRNTFSDGL